MHRMQALSDNTVSCTESIENFASCSIIATTVPGKIVKDRHAIARNTVTGTLMATV
jgi:hypothetical protein